MTSAEGIEPDDVDEGGEEDLATPAHRDRRGRLVGCISL